MADIRQVSHRFAVAPQIALGDIPAISSMGYRHIINNRPDGEEPNQPTSQEIEAAARKEGMTYVHAPFVGQPPADAVKAVMAASAKTLAYCRSGTRSITAWALTEASEGVDPEDIIDRAQEVGYNLGTMRAQLRRLGER
jgi:uncharacterized protein (TIGR01244 family)